MILRFDITNKNFHSCKNIFVNNNNKFIISSLKMSKEFVLL